MDVSEISRESCVLKSTSNCMYDPEECEIICPAMRGDLGQELVVSYQTRESEDMDGNISNAIEKGSAVCNLNRDCFFLYRAPI